MRSGLLPFTAEAFFTVFADYNESVWPMQWVLKGAAIIIVCLSVSKRAWRGRAICALLSFLWAWAGVAYHLLHFSTINPAAFVFAAVFIAEAILFLWWAVSNRSLGPIYRADLRGFIGMVMLGYALVVYPWLGQELGHVYPSTPTFGVPCPMTIFTLGILMSVRDRPATWLLGIPLLWSAIGGSAAFLLGVWQDLGLIVSATLVVTVIGIRQPRARR